MAWRRGGATYYTDGVEMAGWTNRLKANMFAWTFRGVSLPTNYYLALFTADTVPTADTILKSSLTEISAGNGYTTGGIALSRNTTDFDTLTEDTTNDRSLVQVKDITWTATGSIPSSGNGARYVCLTDDNAVQGDREILAYWDLSYDRSLIAPQKLRLQDLELRINES